MALGERFDAVLEGARAGDERALSDIYRDLHPRLVRFLESKASGEGEDLAMEVWLDVAGGLNRFHGEESAFHAWVFTIARRRALDERRGAGRRRTELMANEDLAHRDAGADVEAEVVSEVAFREALEHVRALPRDQADVVLLRVVAGLEVDEVAAILGKRTGTVRVLQHRALKRLAQRLAPVTEGRAERFLGRERTQERGRDETRKA